VTRIYDPSNVLDGDSTTDSPDAAVVRWPLLPVDCPRLLVVAPSGSPCSVADVGEDLQAYGHLLEVGVCDDGAIVGAAAKTTRKGEVVIWTGYAIGEWHPSDIYTRGLGGSETAAWRLSEELAAQGWRVTLYGQFDEEGVFGDVILRDFRSYDPTVHLTAFVSFRNARVFDAYRPNADCTCLWLEDLAGAHSEGLTEQNAANIDHICTVSHWHKQHMQDAYPWLDPQKVVANRNGIDLSFFEGEPEREKRVVYSSSPDRGLDILLEIWPRVREAVPDAELVSTYSRWYDIVAEHNPVMAKSREKLIGMLDQPGVKRLPGGLGQKALAHLMLSSLVWVHPSWYSIHDMQMHETSCISCMEAQAAGCVVVASNWGALSENVLCGTLVDGDPREEGQWRDVFVQSIIRGLTDETTQQMAQHVGPDMMRDMGWFGAAEQLSGLWVKE
jgi:glycosyltransferase involved in cell wall biosynthesis